jgi:alpha-tubulin suppressor-like RCC1 family protein
MHNSVVVRLEDVTTFQKTGNKMGNTSTTVDVNNEANVTTIVNEEPNDVVYICGTSRECQLPTVGRPKLFEVTKTSIADFIPPNKSQRITNVLCGAEHTFVRTTDELYSCGDNNFGLLGHGKTEFRFIEGLKMITSLPVHRVIPTTMNSFFFTDDGEVYAAGYNERGQRATGNVVGTEEPEMISRNLIGDERISIIGGGGAFTILVTESQKIYSCGYNKQGQLGLGNFTDIYTPTLVAPLLFHGEQERVISIKCGYVFAMLLCASGRVYSCGYNKVCRFILFNN